MSRIKVFRKISSILFIIVCFFWIMVMYYDYSGMIPLAMFMLCLLLDGIIFLFVGKKVHITIMEQKAIIHLDGDYLLHLRINGFGWYPFRKVKMTIACRMNRSEEITYEEVEFLPCSGQKKLSLKPTEYGLAQFQVERLVLEDAFGLFNKVLKKNLPKWEVIFLPLPEELYVNLEYVPSVDVEESETFSDDYRGFDSSELFGIREFQEGDRVHQIHWKLSAREGLMMIREFSQPVESNVYVCVDLNPNVNTKEMLQSCTSIAYALLSQEIPFFMCYFAWKHKRIIRRRAEDADDIDSMLYEAILNGIAMKEDYDEELVRKLYEPGRIVYPNDLEVIDKIGK